MILSVVLLQTFALTADYWRKSEEQANLQADAKTVFNLLSGELGNIVYQAASSIGDTFHAPIFIGNSGRRLCFVTHSKIQQGLMANSSGTASYSDICKVEYSFTAPSGGNGGILTRRYAGDSVIVDGTSSHFDFSAGTAADFYPTGMGSSNTVIDTVLDFSATAYDTNSNTVSAGNTFSSDAIRYIRVRLELLPAERFNEYNSLSGTDQDEYRTRYARIFYKTFYIKPINQ